VQELEIGGTRSDRDRPLHPDQTDFERMIRATQLPEQDW
jgi:hypothetical protein